MKSLKLRVPVVRMVAVLFLVAILATPASIASAKSTHAGFTHGGTLVVDPSPVQSWVDTFNPAFSGGNTYGALGLIYESLIQFNGETGKATPWLATKWGWSNHNKTLWFKIRTGVKWNDGQPFTAADVLFSGQEAIKYPAFDGKSGMDPYVTSVSQSGDVVNFHLNQVNTTLLYYIGQFLPILPQHIWSSISNPITYPDSNPVGTGPYMLDSFSSEQYVLKANPNYWQTGLPYVSKLSFPAYSRIRPPRTTSSTARPSGQASSSRTPSTNMSARRLGITSGITRPISRPAYIPTTPSSPSATSGSAAPSRKPSTASRSTSRASTVTRRLQMRASSRLNSRRSGATRPC